MKIISPLLTVDIIIECRGGIVLIERKNPPHGWALPGGFVDWGETVEQAAVREAMEETSLAVTLVEQMHVYSDPKRDPRHHTVSTVFIGRAEGEPVGADDARKAVIVPVTQLPQAMAFDHAAILRDYLDYKNGKPRIEVFGYHR